MTVKIYHNPRCSKSRQTLELVEQNSNDIAIVEYLKTPLNAEQISELVALLGFTSVRELMRTKETIYKELALANEQDEQVLLNAMVENPKLIERPIVVNQGKAAIGRPPESVLAIL